MEKLVMCFTIFTLLFVIGTEGVNGMKTYMSTEKRPPHDRAVVCYLSTWAVYRPGRGAFTIDDIDPSLCTHLVYAFVGLNNVTNEIKSLDPHNDLEENYGKGSFKKVTALKIAFPHLKVTLAIGGWNEGSTNYSVMVSTPEKRRQFINSAVSFLRKYDFDGLDLDWEYPANRGGKPEDKQNFVSLIKELRQEFDKYNWIITAALGASKTVIDSAYDVPELGQYLDLMHIMCYDYHGTWDKATGSNAPLFGMHPKDTLSVDFTLRYYLRLGAPANKLVVGLPLYGRTFITTGPDGASGLGEPAKEKGFQGQFTKEDGYMSYHEICLELGPNNSSWQKHWDKDSETPYAIQDNKLITYDDAKSLERKVKFSMESDIAGVMVWPLDNDDFRGECPGSNVDGYTNYPLLRTINKAIADSINEKKNKKNEIQTEDEMQKNDQNGAVGLSASLSAFLAPVVLAAMLRK